MDNSQYPFDGTGIRSGNLVTRERHHMTAANSEAYHTIIPLFSPFFEDGVILESLDDDVYTPLDINDYTFAFKANAVGEVLRKPVYGQIVLNIIGDIGDVYITYTTVGGQDITNYDELLRLCEQLSLNPRMANWDNIVGFFGFWQPTNHPLDAEDIGSYGGLIHSVNEVSDALSSRSHSELVSHMTNGNAHGLGQVKEDLFSRIARLEQDVNSIKRSMLGGNTNI